MFLSGPNSDTRKSEDYSLARDAALRFLTYRARSESEVQRRLARKFSPLVIELVITSLRTQHFLDDAAFALQWRRNREDHRPRSDRLLQQELQLKGVPSEIVREALVEYDNPSNAYRAGRQLAQKLADRAASEGDFRKRLSSHLQRRGFRYSLVRETVEMLWQELAADPLHGGKNAKAD